MGAAVSADENIGNIVAVSLQWRNKTLRNFIYFFIFQEIFTDLGTIISKVHDKITSGTDGGEEEEKVDIIQQVVSIKVFPRMKRNYYIL